MTSPLDNQTEWLESDGLGGFASGTTSGLRTRRYHALLLCATTPPTGRMTLVNGFDAWVDEFPLSQQHYASEQEPPAVLEHLRSFRYEPWPTWEFALRDGSRVRQELVLVHGAMTAILRWTLLASPHGSMQLRVRPFFSGRDYHALHHENESFRFAPEVREGLLSWHPYQGVPGIVAQTSGEYRHEPHWYRQFAYQTERDRGLDWKEDLASPGEFHWELRADQPATLAFSAELVPGSPGRHNLEHLLQVEERRRRAFASPLHRAADAYLVKRGAGKTIIAGYPWFTDWGRDTFIALRGLCLTTGRYAEAESILLSWAGAVSQGMLPNRFPDRGEEPEYNSVDAAMWYIVAIHEFLQAAKPNATVKATLLRAVEDILTGYASGTRHSIRMDDDGLLAAGEPGVQLTWMDAKVGDWVVTPRIGKPVEVNALWLNALWIAGQHQPHWLAIYERAMASFQARFWNADERCLYDVVDEDHQPGKTDARIRPNQILAVGGLPRLLLPPTQARQVVERIEAELWTPVGLRSLTPKDPGYCGTYRGGVFERDGAYHQGTVWPWLMGPFVEAWLRVNRDVPRARENAHSRYLAPLLEHLKNSGMGHLFEVADGESPHRAGGCPFQAWSLAEVLRVLPLVTTV